MIKFSEETDSCLSFWSIEVATPEPNCVCSACVFLPSSSFQAYPSIKRAPTADTNRLIANSRYQSIDCFLPSE